MFGRRKRMGDLFGFGPEWLGGDLAQRRLFGKGDLKYVILDLLKDEPSHGYELIRRLEQRFGGFYSPSPGSVYPTLQLLEDLGHVSVAEREGRKVYTLTEEGRAFLSEHRRSVEEIWERAAGSSSSWEPELKDELREIKYEVKDLVRLAMREMRAGRVDREKMRRVREVISRASREIEDVLRERGQEGDDQGQTRA